MLAWVLWKTATSDTILWRVLFSNTSLQLVFLQNVGIIAAVNTFHKNWNFWTWTIWIHTLAAHLLRDRSTSSFFQRSVGLGSPWTWHLNSRLSSTRTTWFTGRCTNTGLSESRQNILQWFSPALDVCSKPLEKEGFYLKKKKILFYVSGSSPKTESCAFSLSLSPTMLAATHT